MQAEIVAANQFRRYGGSLATTSRVRGAIDVNHKWIGYAVGRRNFTSSTLDYLKDPGLEAPISQEITVNPALHAEMDSQIRKFMNTSPDYTRADLSAVICRLAAGMAHYANSGQLTGPILSGGKQLNVISLRARIEALPQHGHVFVPQQAALLHYPAALYAMICAINGEDAVAVVDCLRVNPLNNAAIMEAYAGVDLYLGVETALRMLLSMYEQSGAGAQAAVAVAKGIHSVVSVVAHSDEGGFLRDVWREGYFCTPYGAVYVPKKLNGFTRFPVCPRGDLATAQALVDSIALKTAACAALADPCVQIGDRRYPTIATVGDDTESGEARAFSTSDELNRELRREIFQSSATFVENYVRLITPLFTASDEGVDEGSYALSCMFRAACDRSAPNRHCHGQTVAWCYWVEPTSLFRRADNGTATNAGFGVLAGTSEKVTLPAYPGLEVMYDNSQTVGIAMEFRSARTVPAVVHHQYHKEDGLACLEFYQARPERFALVGGGLTNANVLPDTIVEAMNNGATMDAYMWKHGMCALPSPAELMYTGNKVGVRVHVLEQKNAARRRFGPHKWVENRIILPTTVEGEVSTVTYRANTPVAFTVGDMGDATRDVRRSRSRAEESLALATRDARMARSARPLALMTVFEEPGALEYSGSAASVLPDPLTEVAGGVDHKWSAPTVRQGPARAIVVTETSGRTMNLPQGVAESQPQSGVAVQATDENTQTSSAATVGTGADPQPPSVGAPAAPRTGAPVAGTPSALAQLAAAATAVPAGSLAPETAPPEGVGGSAGPAN